MRTIQPRKACLVVTLGILLLFAHRSLTAARPAPAGADGPTPAIASKTALAIAPTIERAFADLRARDLQGRELTAATLRGRIVVLDFWATWCAPCLAEIPTLQRLRREHAAEQVEIVSVSLDVLDRRQLVTWLRRHRATWTQVHDRRGYNGDLSRAFLVHGLPTMYVFDGTGRLAATNVRGERLRLTVAALVGAR